MSDMLKQLEEERTGQILSSFSSPLNNDVEYFLKQKAILFDKQSISRTHLVFTSYRGEVVLVGYFTLAYKEFTIPAKNISRKLKDRINKFGNYDCDIRAYKISAPLIAQLSKNFTNDYCKLITGDELLKMACDMASEIHMIAGGKIVYVECEDKVKLRDFYEDNGFVIFNERQLDARSKEKMGVDYLLQLLRYF
ncbi:MAG: GNAT family acetyltransferase [Synergistaceae bacterium]|nr:GNAT family acetyltransferase [Synergistaceae bacterium]